MMVLYVLFDSRCGLCRRVTQWLMAQPTWVELRFVAAASEESRRLFPTVSTAGEELIVISDQGEVYSGDQSWVMCLWALVEYRELAYRLSSPLLLPLARSAFAAISRHRQDISEWLRPEYSEREMATRLSQLPEESCAVAARQTMPEEQR